MKIHSIYLFIFISLLFTFLNINSASACTPNYLCTDWGTCNKEVQSRTCEDTVCGTGQIVERRLCSTSSGKVCSTEYQCTDWGTCNYFGKTQDLISNKLRFSGYQERACTDFRGCSEAFVEERKCTDSFDVNFVNVERCGVSLVVALDINSKKEVSTISADAWKMKKLDIAFVQSNFSYCPNCYNGVQDGDEEEIDCGGSCRACSEETGERNQIILVSSSWLISGLLFLALIFSSVLDKKTKLRYNIYQVYSAIDSGNKEKLAKYLALVRNNYKSMKPEQKTQFAKEIEQLYRRI